MYVKLRNQILVSHQYFLTRNQILVSHQRERERFYVPRISLSKVSVPRCSLSKVSVRAKVSVLVYAT